MLDSPYVRRVAMSPACYLPTQSDITVAVAWWFTQLYIADVNQPRKLPKACSLLCQR
ncbi:hypothetical protein SPB21_27135 [Leptothoe sp. ISB3NOV94-8A]|nr:hypothetical protein [Leptothoe sp. LEGE 181152]